SRCSNANVLGALLVIGQLAFGVFARMKKLCHLIATVNLVVLLSGCFMHTVVGNGNGVESPDGRLTLRVESHGASRKAYVDMTKKRVFIFIWRRPPNYMSDDWERL